MDKQVVSVGIMIVCLCFIFFMIGVAFSYRAGFNYAAEHYNCTIITTDYAVAQYYREHNKLPPGGVNPQWANDFQLNNS